MIKRFYNYFNGYKKALIISGIFTSIECILELLIPFIMSDIIDKGVVMKDKSYIIVRATIMLGFAVFGLVTGLLYAHYGAIASQGFGSELRRIQYEKLQKYSFSNLDKFSTSSLVTRLTGDVNILQGAVSNGIRPIIRGPVSIVVGMVLATLLNQKLALVFFVAMPILAFSLGLIVRKIRPLYSKMQKTIDKVNLVVQENLTAIKMVKSFSMGNYESTKFREINKENQEISTKALGFAVLNTPVFQFIMYATVIAILWFGGGMLQIGGVSVGELTGFLSYVLMILNALMMISGVFLSLSRSVSSAVRIAEVIDEEPNLLDGNAAHQHVSCGEIEFKNVSFKYSEDADEFALKNINIHILPGQTIGILGGTGSAKSSLVQLIPRLYDISAGELLIDGVSVKDYPMAHLRDSIGMVLQRNTLFSGTLRENLQWGNPTATNADFNWACGISSANEFIDRMPKGYESLVEQGGTNFSGGQRQRLCIARALLKKPKVLILDDSTSAVDTATEAHIRAGLQEDLKDTTKIIIAQRISSVQEADQIIILEDGQINEIGTHDKLLAGNEIYQDIYQAQLKGAMA